jgi:hypothetical protein
LGPVSKWGHCFLRGVWVKDGGWFNRWCQAIR